MLLNLGTTGRQVVERTLRRIFNLKNFEATSSSSTCQSRNLFIAYTGLFFIFQDKMLHGIMRYRGSYFSTLLAF